MTSTRERPPIGSDYWRRARPDAIGVWNAQYLPNGERRANTLSYPWNVDAPENFDCFATYAEALKYATQEAQKQELTR